ncbi:Crp/Fnr family transcriptional regulator [Sphingobacterium thalpophilum]|uniref:Crp/Fnr family transcriptional regulator n=1 Tax=Sphingobacterium thalpophilum TaxID=259 RepID=A0A4V6KQ08_9SPHI|nr:MULTISPECIES: Crp/Fnr family transcriptional regulator [Sphingobacterium]MCW8310484.1 Crp/Fnr family transcriptional regulator [Sphingobacterium sp. InxBP1]VTR31938.1 Cyclic nucleotide-binding domain [Sphingobacterium thalpophilum]
MGETAVISLADCLQSYHFMNPDSSAKIEQISKKLVCKRNSILVQQDKIQHSIYFLGSGLARVYYETSERQITLDFVSPGGTLISMNSYVHGTAGYENIDLLEESTVYQIDQEQLFELYESDIAIANWGRKMAELEFIKAEQRSMSKLFSTAQERYAELLKKYPQYIQRIKLGYIASYLGVSQVTLSRIRANIQSNF